MSDEKDTPRAESPLKPYREPELVENGSLAELTEGFGGPPGDTEGGTVT